jgi:DNA-binding NarL/FixJ family response regulator
MKKTMEVLIITPSIVLQQGLGALIESLPGIRSVKAIKELSSAYSWIETYQPTLVLLDLAMLGSDIRTVLAKFQAISPDMQRVLLVDHVEDVRWVPQYAEAILVKGEAPSAVAAIVTSLLFSKGDGHEHDDPNE